MLKRLLLSLGFFLFLFSGVGHATTMSAIVVASCGTPPGTYTAGQPFALNIDTTGKLCTSGSGGGGGGTSSTFGATFPTTGTAIGASNGTNMEPLLVNGSGYLEVDVVAGGAGGGAVYGPTAAGSPAANPPVLLGGTVDGTSTGNVDNLKVAGGVGYINIQSVASTNLGTPVAWGSTPSGVALSANVDVLASILPTGAATSALQTTGNTSLATLATNLPPQGQALAAASTPVVLTAAQIATLTPPAAITGFSTSANQSTEISSLATIATNTGAALPAGGNVIGAVTKVPQTPVSGASGAITSLVLKASATSSPGGVFYFHAENATATAGYCVLYNAASAPSTGALTAASVLAFQYFPASGYCDVERDNAPIVASIGAVVLLTSAATPYTYTTGTITGSIYGAAQ